MYRIPSLEALIEELSKLPSIGRKSAMRMAYHLMRADPARVEALEVALRRMRETLRSCAICFNLAEESPCPICRDPRRDRAVLCVVEEPADLFAFEQTGGFRGLYHVLEGTLNPMKGVTPEEIRVGELLRRLRQAAAEPASAVREVILATNPNVDGEATAHFVAEEIHALDAGIRVTRLGLGLPMGGDLEYADQMTLFKALEGRRPV